ncbi:MAG: dihydrolipoyl dehydrogenase [Acidiferrobacterales bacterium]
MTDSHKVIVIGAGPAGYVAAIRCAQLGMDTVCIDRWVDDQGKAIPGGTCLNAGCIPSKALLESSELFEKSTKDFATHGIKIASVELDLSAMMVRKQKIVADLNAGVSGLLKINGVKYINGNARLLPNREIEVSEATDKKPFVLSAENIIIATGSLPAEIGAAPLDGKLIVDSSDALAFDEVPKRLGVIGAGVVGLELGSVWRRLGSEVVLLEAQEQFLLMVDEQIARDALKDFTSQGMDIRLGARVTGCKISGKKVAVEYEDSDGVHQEKFDKLVVAVGRKPNINGLNTSDTELLMDEWGVIHVDNQCRTNLPCVFAIGDVVRGPMLAHKGSQEGIMVAELIAGNHAEVDYETIPSVIYTQPEIAWVGKNEQMLKSAGRNYRVGVFPFSASGRARALGETSGMVKILSDSATDRVLGVHIVGPQASELVAQAKVAMEFQASSEDIGLIMFAHPTLSEAFHEAALAVNDNAIHIGASKKSKKK